MRQKQMGKHKFQYFREYYYIFNTILRMENIGQIYQKHKIREILKCDMTKALEQDQKSSKLKFQMKL